METAGLNGTVQSVGFAAGVGAAAIGTTEAIKQKVIFKNADKFIAQNEAKLTNKKKFLNPLFTKSKETCESKLKKLNNSIEKLKTFAKNQNFDYKAMKKAAAVGAAAGTTIALGLNALKKFSTKTNDEDKNIEYTTHTETYAEA